MSNGHQLERKPLTPPLELQDDSYVSRPGHKNEPAPVMSDGERVEDSANGSDANSDAQLERDDKEAISKSNIINERTRGVAKPKGTYAEPGDEEGLPKNDGTSST
ncbi:hypothetical protein B0T25DRAFT_518488 [Lasiosphaeria hispida]|uniref:Histone chaperone domain-containing protein n=1 Tax=Lasiosphaeria hispida TaxID=260671 RepID=A0AAJ0HIN4_9PEZI|nr:hypothetical protein B0T25DRAFT_518488 [Lasiosphaeria hispida]